MVRRAAWSQLIGRSGGGDDDRLEDLVLAVAGADQGGDVAIGESMGAADNGVDERGEVGGHLSVVEHGPPDCGGQVTRRVSEMGQQALPFPAHAAAPPTSWAPGPS